MTNGSGANLDTIAFQMRGALDAEFAAWYPRSSIRTVRLLQRPGLCVERRRPATEVRCDSGAPCLVSRTYAGLQHRHSFTAIAAHGIAFSADQSILGPRWAASMTWCGRWADPGGWSHHKAYGSSFAVCALAECAGVGRYRRAPYGTRDLPLARCLAMTSSTEDTFNLSTREHPGKGWRILLPKINSSIHLLEACPLQVWPDPTVQRQLELYISCAT
jgi:hypothetical protein